MKKVLFATTALVATAGVAAAEVTFGGLARFGVYYQEGLANETTIESRFRLIVTATKESDNGLSFGAQIRYQANEHRDGYNGSAVTGTSTTTVANDAAFNTPRFWVTAGGFTVSVGQVLGAIENMPGMYTGSVGLTGLGFANVVYGGADAYTSGASGRQGLDVLWSGGNWGVHFTYTPDQSTQFTGSVASPAAAAFTNERTALAVSYTMGNWTFAVAGQDSDLAGDTDWAATVGSTFGDIDVAFQIADNDGDYKYGIAGNWQVASGTFVRGYINHDEALAGGSGDENIGIGFQHRMGNGTFFEGGVADLGGTTRADLGLRFSF